MRKADSSTDEWRKNVDEPYYADAETDELAEALHRTPGMRVLFDASRNLDKSDLEFLAEMAKRIKGSDDE
jgi:hypothetical protein